jgi:hypothetical protein
MTPRDSRCGAIVKLGVGLELVDEFTKDETERARRANGPLQREKLGSDIATEIQFVNKAIRFVIDNGSTEEKRGVGGAIDVAVVREHAGVDWSARKPECASKDLAISAQ